ncbi:MAG: hypothetical protein HYZ47_04300, partial [Simkania negevensis]|nr:hypothetical protein [Simkania negevensis]
DVIRFTVGLENQKHLEQHAQLISDFCYVLSNYVAESPQAFDLEKFIKAVKQTHRILNGSEDFTPVSVPLKEEDRESSGYFTIGAVDIAFTNLQLSLKASKNTKGSHSVSFIPQRKILWFDEPPADLFSDLLKLFFHLNYLSSKPVFVVYDRFMNSYEILGFLSTSFPLRYPKVRDELSGVEIDFELFSLVQKDGRKFSADRVYVKISEELDRPVCLSKLNSTRLDKIFTHCARDHLAIKPHEAPGSILLTFLGPKESLDYQKAIYDCFKNETGDIVFTEAGMHRLINFLNGMDPKKLPLTHDHSYQYSLSSLQTLCRYLTELVISFVGPNTRIRKEIIEEMKRMIGSIKYGDYRIAIQKAWLAGLNKRGHEDASEISLELAMQDYLLEVMNTYLEETLRANTTGETPPFDKWLSWISPIRFGKKMGGPNIDHRDRLAYYARRMERYLRQHPSGVQKKLPRLDQEELHAEKTTRKQECVML